LFVASFGARLTDELCRSLTVRDRQLSEVARDQDLGLSGMYVSMGNMIMAQFYETS
jgi:hypothetical protein